MSDTPASPPGAELPFPAVRRNLPAGAALEWLRLGWSDLRACGRASLFYGVCFCLMGWLLLWGLGHAAHLLSGITAGFMLVGPFVAIGLYALSRQREAGEPIALVPTLLAWRSKRGAIGIYSLLLIIIYLVWARASMVTFALFFEGSIPDFPALIDTLLRLEDLEFFAIYLLVGGFFALLVFAASLVSIPLMLDRDQDAITAVIASVLAMARNPAAALVWASLIVTLIGIGLATAFVGLIITGPWVGHATWHAFRALIEPLPDNPRSALA